jgi:DNA-binding CsgD family transcriptional regulator
MSAPFLGLRQVQCLRLAAAGLEYREIAERLGIAMDTVRIHLVKARNVLGARNTRHAVAIAMHHGYVTAEHLELP